MKKYIIGIILLLIPFQVNAKKMEVNLAKCVDGDTAYFNYQGKEIKTRFLAVDTPETKHPSKGEEPFGKDASRFTCDSLTNAQKITLETDPGSDELDKYDRYLVWVYVDDKLLQKELIENGYAKVAYLYGDYLYTDSLKTAEKIAQQEQKGIWGDYVEPKDYTIYYIIGGVVILILLALIIPKLNNNELKKVARKSNTKLKNNVKKNLKKYLK